MASPGTSQDGPEGEGTHTARHTVAPITGTASPDHTTGFDRFTQIVQRTATTAATPTRVVTESASGLDPDRVLVFGNALFAGGADAATGARRAADRLAAGTGRGADVTAVPWSMASGESLVAAVRGLDCRNYDVVVIALPADVVRDRTPSSFVLDLLDVIDEFRGRVHGAARFVVSVACGVRQGHVAAALQASQDGIVAIAVDDDAEVAHACVLDVTRAVLADQRARSDSPQRYRDAPQSHLQRHDAIAALGILDTPTEERFDRIVDAMSRLFRTKGAAVNLVPDGRQWSKARSWYPAGDTPLRDSFCRTTVTSAGPMVVGDAWQHTRVLPRSDVRFYAGYPVDTLDGIRVGAVCVFDPEPRDEQSVELHLLRDFAIRVRTELYR